MIKRKSIQYDICHGGTFNECFTDKGLLFYEQNGSKAHSDKIVNSPKVTFVQDTDEEGNPLDNLNICATTNVANCLNVGENTCIEGTLCVDDATTLNCTLDVCKATCIDDTLNVSCAVCFCDELTVDCNTLLCCNLEVCCNATVDCDTLICGCTEICGETTIQGVTTVNANLNVNGTTTIAGDLYVKGTAYEEHSTDLYVGADFITLRESSETGLDTGEKAGLIINNYDGEDSLGIITDSSGILRIGEFNTVKVYTTDDTDFFEDRDLTKPTTIPDGKKLFQIGETDPDTGLKEYYYISKDDTEPIATRDSDDNMHDKSYVWWDEEGKDLHASPAIDTDYHNIPYYNQCTCENDNAYLTPNKAIVVTDEEKVTNIETCANSIIVTDEDKVVCNLEPDDEYSLLITKECKPAWFKTGCDRQVLTTCVNEDGEAELKWSTCPAICCYATRECYEADKANVPIGSVVLIDECTNYIVSEQVEVE